MNTEHPSAHTIIDDLHPILTKELLEEEYIHNGLSDRGIAKKYGVGSHMTVRRRRQVHGIENSHPTKSNTAGGRKKEIFLSLDDAIRMRDDGLDYFQMAESLGCSRMSVCRRMKELGLVRETKEAQKKLRWHAPLTDLQIKFLLGTLLGDGSITKGGMFQCNHCAAQMEYIRWKMEMLSSLMNPEFELVPHNATDGDSDKLHIAYYLRTMQNEHLKLIRTAFYPDGTKIFPFKYLTDSGFDSLSLAVWYMDDGGRNNNSSKLSTYGFGYEGNLDILKFLKIRFGIEGSLVPHKQTNSYFVNFNVRESEKLFTIVAPHIVPCLLRKLPQAFRPLPVNNGA